MTVAEVYFWDGWQTVEETDSSGNLQRQYVWGEGIDECLKAHLKDAADIDADSDTTDFVDLYYHHNSIGSVVAVTNAAGAVKESYRYSAFGKPTIYNASNVEIAATAVKQPFMFTGARYDFEEGGGLYQMRMRYYDPVVGRFVSRDPLGLWGDPSQNGNGQGYCGHNPVNRRDPMGDRVFVDTTGLNGVDATNFTNDVVRALEKIKEHLRARMDDLQKRKDALDEKFRRQEAIVCDPASSKRKSDYAKDKARELNAEIEALAEELRTAARAFGVIDDMESSAEVVVTIKRGDLGTKNKYRFNEDTIYWNPELKQGGQVESGTDQRDPHIGLAHELSHAYDDLVLKEPEEVRHGAPTDGDAARWKNRTEERATKLENEVRRGQRAAEKGNTPPDRKGYNAGDWDD